MPHRSREPRRNRAPAAIATVVLILAIVAAVFWRESQQSRAAVDQPAPAFTLPDLTGRDVTLQSMQGEVVFLNFWTTWCDGCIIEMPALVTFQQRYGHKLLQIGINVQEPIGTVEAFLTEFAVNYPTLLDLQSRVPDRYRLRAFPESWVIDRDGIARYHKPGPMSFEEMAAAYELAAGESLADDHRGPLPADRQARALFVDAAGSVWLGGSGGLWRLQHGAWSELTPTGVDGIYLIQTSEAGLLVGTDAGVLVSTDVGATWQPYLSGLPPGAVTGLAMGPTGPIAWVSGHGLYRHEADTWQPLAASLPLAYPWVRLQAAPNGTLYAATPDGLQRSDDGGVTWVRTRHRHPVYDLNVVAETIWLAGDEGLYQLGLGTEDYRGVLPGREKWLSVYAGAPARRLTALAASGDQLWVLAPTGDIYRSGPGQWELAWPLLAEED